MKKFLLIVILISGIGAESVAQFQKDSWMLEGGVGLGRTRFNNVQLNEKGNPTTTLSFSPKVGYFIKDQFAIGLSGSWNTQSTRFKMPNSSVNQRQSIQTFGGGVFLRKYFTITEDLSFFGESGIDFSWSRYRSRFGDPPKSDSFEISRGFGIYSEIGIQYFISPKVGTYLASTIFRYTSERTDRGFITTERQFQTGFILDPRFGFTFFF